MKWLYLGRDDVSREKITDCGDRIRKPIAIVGSCSFENRTHSRAHGAEWRAPEHRSREAQRAACRSAPGRRSRQALAAASAESEEP